MIGSSALLAYPWPEELLGAPLNTGRLPHLRRLPDGRSPPAVRGGTTSATPTSTSSGDPAQKPETVRRS